MLKEMPDLLHQDLWQIAVARDALIKWMKLVDGHGDDLLVDALLVLHEQRADRPRADDHSRGNRCRRDHHAVERITVLGQRVRDEAVIRRIEHRRVQEAVDEHGAGGLVDLVFDRCAALRDLDDDVDLVRRIFANRDMREVHGYSSLVMAGLDPGIPFRDRSIGCNANGMDCRVKPGNDVFYSIKTDRAPNFRRADTRAANPTAAGTSRVPHL